MRTTYRYLAGSGSAPKELRATVTYRADDYELND
jgi:hypothetical protein